MRVGPEQSLLTRCRHPGLHPNCTWSSATRLSSTSHLRRPAPPVPGSAP